MFVFTINNYFGTQVAISFVNIDQTAKEATQMAFYIHLGCELSGKPESTRFVDAWIHAVPLFIRLAIMETVLDL